MAARYFFLALVMAVLGVTTISAQWSPDPAVRNPICTSDSVQRYNAMCTDGHGGAIIAWEDQYQDTIHTYIYAERISDVGITLWRTNGLVLTTCIEDMQHKPKLCSDGAGGAIIAFYQDSGARQIYAARFDSNGIRKWGCAGLKVSNTSTASEISNLFPDGSGGAYVVWGVYNYLVSPEQYDVYVTRIDNTGSPVWSQPAHPASTTGSLYLLTSGADTLGNVFVGWMQQPSSATAKFVCQKVLSNGTLAWAAAGVAPVDTGAAQGSITGDELGGAFVVTAGANANQGAITHLNSAGTKTWSTIFANGSAYITSFPVVATDGFGGAIAGCVAQVNQMGSVSKLAMQRVNASGNPLWGANGLIISNPVSNHNIGPLVLVNDGMGGAICGWQENHAKPLVYATRVDSSGNFFWGATGKTICNGNYDHVNLVGGRDYPGQFLCAWTDSRDTATRSDIYAAKLGDPWLHVTDTLIDFGKLNVGDTLTIVKQNFLENIGVEDLNIPIDQLLPASQYEIQINNDTAGLTLHYREQRDLVASFVPVLPGNKSADLTYTSNTAYYSSVIHFRGRAVTPAMTINPLVNMGTVIVGGSRDSTITAMIRSTGSGYLHVDSIRIAIGNGVFTIDSGNIAPVILDSGKILTLKIGFAPQVNGVVRDTVLVYNNSGSVGKILLLGTGTKGTLVLSQFNVDFGNVLVNTPSQLTIHTSAPKANVTVSSSNFSGGDSTQFSITLGAAPYTVVQRDSQAVTLQFLPTTIGEKNSTLYFVTSTNDTVPLSVRGNGVTQQARQAKLSVAGIAVDLGTVLVGGKRDSVLTAWITNTGDTTLTVSHMSIIGANATEFSVTDSALGFSIDSGMTQSVTVHFAPQSAGAKTSYLTFTSNSATTSQVELLGNGQANQGSGIISVASNNINCGNSKVLIQKSVTVTGFIHNTGTAMLNVTGMSIGGTNNGDFLVSSQKIFTLAANDSADISIVFTPGNTGARTATLQITSDVGNASLVTLNGFGTNSKLTLSESEIDFGKTPVGVPRDTIITALITNAGTDTAIVSGVNFTGVNFSSFTTVATLPPFVLAPNATQQMHLRFTPVQTGLHLAELDIIDKAGDTARANVLGRGVREIFLSIGNAEGTPGTTVLVPVTADTSLSGTSITGVDMNIIFTARQFYPTEIVTGNTSSAGWIFSGPAISADTAIVHGTGTQPLAAGTHLFDLKGTILQSNIVHAPITITAPSPTGDADVTMSVKSVGTITMDSICGFGTQVFSATNLGLMVWSPVPNPATNSVQVQYSLAAQSPVNIFVRDENGTMISQTSATQSAGLYSLNVDTHVFLPGMYFCTITANGMEQTKKFLVRR